MRLDKIMKNERTFRKFINKCLKLMYKEDQKNIRTPEEEKEFNKNFKKQLDDFAKFEQSDESIKVAINDLKNWDKFL